MCSLMRLGFAFALLSVVAGHAHAQTAAEDRWKYTAGFYGWLSGVEGTMAAFGAPEVDASASLSDILDRFDGALMGFGEARRGRFSVGADILWARLSQEEDAALGTLASGVKVTTENSMLTGVAGYAVVDRPTATLDVVAGARYWSVDIEIAFRGGTLGGRSVSDGDDWVDPVVGVSGNVDLGAKFYFTGWALIGGFGAGSDSMWDVMGALGYPFSDRFSAIAGYRALGVDYEKGGFAYDVEQSGIMLGGVFMF